MDKQYFSCLLAIIVLLVVSAAAEEDRRDEFPDGRESGYFAVFQIPEDEHYSGRK